MTPVTVRIRWTDKTAYIAGHAGTLNPAAFQIFRPHEDGEEWTVTADLPGAEGVRRFGADEAEAKAEAEKWLEEFVTSLGASFGADAIVRWQDVRDGDLVLLDDCLITAERAEICQKPWGHGADFTAADIYHRLDNGVLVSSERHGDRYTAVRRAAGKEAR